MIKTIKITSKRQITLPVQIFNSLGLRQGDRLSVDASDGKIVLQKPEVILDELYGSLKLPAQLRGLSPDEIISRAKKNYFEHKK